MSKTFRANPMLVGMVRHAAWVMGWPPSKTARFFGISVSWASKLSHPEKYPFMSHQAAIEFDELDREGSLTRITAWRRR